jgi:hypothetical protein
MTEPLSDFLKSKGLSHCLKCLEESGLDESVEVLKAAGQANLRCLLLESGLIPFDADALVTSLFGVASDASTMNVSSPLPLAQCVPSPWLQHTDCPITSSDDEFAGRARYELVPTQCADATFSPSQMRAAVLAACEVLDGTLGRRQVAISAARFNAVRARQQKPPAGSDDASDSEDDSVGDALKSFLALVGEIEDDVDDDRIDPVDGKGGDEGMEGSRCSEEDSSGGDENEETRGIKFEEWGHAACQQWLRTLPASLGLAPWTLAQRIAQGKGPRTLTGTKADVRPRAGGGGSSRVGAGGGAAHDDAGVAHDSAGVENDSVGVAHDSAGSTSARKEEEDSEELSGKGLVAALESVRELK